MLTARVLEKHGNNAESYYRMEVGAMALHSESKRTHVYFPGLAVTGGKSSRRSRFERGEHVRNGPSGSHMPIDTRVHWRWNNPLNVIPLSLAAMFVYAIVGTVVSLF